jgi:hypothetical protein
LLLADYKRVVKLTEKVKGFLTDQVRLRPQTLLSPALVYVLELSTHRNGSHSRDSAHCPSLNHTLTPSFPPSLPHSLTHSLFSSLAMRRASRFDESLDMLNKNCTSSSQILFFYVRVAVLMPRASPQSRGALTLCHTHSFFVHRCDRQPDCPGRPSQACLFWRADGR